MEGKEDEIIIIMALLSSCFCLPLNMCLFKIYDSMINKFELRQQNIIYEENIRLFVKEMKLKEEVAISRDLVHDMKKHFLIIKDMARQAFCNDIVNYLETLSEHYKNTKKLVNSGNSVIDTLINSKYLLVEKLNIKYDINVVIPDKIKIDDADLCILFGNVLDNAFEAMEKSDKRIINISVVYKLGKLSIGIKNTYTGQVIKNRDNQYVSTKLDYYKHGVGMRLVERIVEKYDGFCYTEYDDEYFVFVAILNEY